MAESERPIPPSAPDRGGGGFKLEERFVGPDGRQWAKWLVRDPNDYEEIEDQDLKKLIGKLARTPDSVVTPEHLRNVFFKVEELLDEGKISDSEAALWGERISARAEIVTEVVRIKEATALAEAQGRLTPKQYLGNFLDAEEHLKAPFQIVPGSEPPFWVILNEKEKREWVVRSTLTIAAYKKVAAVSVEDLYMDKMKELAIDLNKDALKTIFGKEGVLPAIGIYVTIIGDQHFYGLRNEEVEYYDENGKPREYNLKRVFCDVLSDKQTKKGLKRDYGEEILKELMGRETSLRKGCPDSIYPTSEWERDGEKRGTSIDQESFGVLRRAVRYWLATKCRHLLLREGETVASFGGGEIAFREMERRARDAEQIAWNFVFSTSVLEHFDSRQYRPPGTERHHPSNFWTLFQWMVMHPQERFEQKIARGTEAKEEWSALGTWGVFNVSKGVWTVGNKVELPEHLRALPDVLIRDALHPLMHKTAMRQVGSRSDFIKLGKRDELFFEPLRKIGEITLFNTAEAKRASLEGMIHWDNIPDAAFVPFIFDEMRWADVVLQVFKKGVESKVNLADLGEAMRNLRLRKESRERLLIAYFGALPQSQALRPKESTIEWRLRMAALKEYYPNLFLDK